MKRTIPKKNVAVGECMSNTKRDRDIREDNSNNINIRGPTCLCVFAYTVLLLYLNIISLSDE